MKPSSLPPTLLVMVLTGLCIFMFCLGFLFATWLYHRINAPSSPIPADPDLENYRGCCGDDPVTRAAAMAAPPLTGNARDRRKARRRWRKP